MPGTLAAVGILSAVLHARETGEGQFLDVAMYDAVLSLCEHYVYLYSYGGENPGPMKTFGQMLAQHGYEKSKSGVIIYHGLAIKYQSMANKCQSMANFDCEM